MGEPIAAIGQKKRAENHGNHDDGQQHVGEEDNKKIEIAQQAVRQANGALAVFGVVDEIAGEKCHGNDERAAHHVGVGNVLFSADEDVADHQQSAGGGVERGVNDRERGSGHEWD